MAIEIRLATAQATTAGQKFRSTLAGPTGGFVGLAVSGACDVTVRVGVTADSLFDLALVKFAGARTDSVEIPRGVEFIEVEVSAVLTSFTAKIGQ